MVTDVTGTTGDDGILIPDLYPDSTDSFEINAFKGDDMILAGEGDDVINAGKGDDSVDGGAGDDTIIAGKGEDVVSGGTGDDTISGGKDDDVIDGGLGADNIEGNLGNDILKGGKGADVIFGGQGDDMIYGNKGNNELYGGSGQDVIDTGRNGSIVDGGSGQDIIKAYSKNGGYHTLTGGSEADSFEFYAIGTKKRSKAEITDFELGLDGFSIAGQSDDDFMADLLAGGANATLYQSGDDLVLKLDKGLTVTFDDIDLDDFVAAYSSETVLV